MGDQVQIRQATEADTEAIISLAGEALGWAEDEPNAEMFAWKHQRNPFGRSPAWVAERDGELAGFRTFLRWEWRSSSGRILRTVRAVDTATAPRHQGKGVFRALTTAAVQEMRAEGVDFVFNTPNDQSRPGYLRMGWEVVGRVPVGVGLASPWRAMRLARARVPAEKWSLPSDSGQPAAEVLADRMGLAALLAGLEPSAGLRTNLSPAFLQWRYAGGPVTYRAITAPEGLAAGLILYRLRRRGTAVEATLADLLVPSGTSTGSVARSLVRRVRRESGADYIIGAQHGRLGHRQLARVVELGPVLTWRPVAEPTRPTIEGWDLRLGDIELF